MSRVAEQLGGWSNTDLGEVMYELIHALDALGSLRIMFGLPAEGQNAEPGAAADGGGLSGFWDV